jgi:cephalosporin hydroxylase
MKWKGLPLFKTVFDCALMPMLLDELKPGTIFEIGAGAGASALWLADLLRVHANPAIIHSVDIRPLTSTDPQIVFYRGDCARPESLFPQEVLRMAPHPWLVIEDAHVNVAAVLIHIDGFMQRGDYLVVEDSLIKKPDLITFVQIQPRYLVDTYYTDFFGRNATCAADSIFRRT